MIKTETSGINLGFAASINCTKAGLDIPDVLCDGTVIKIPVINTGPINYTNISLVYNLNDRLVDKSCNMTLNTGELKVCRDITYLTGTIKKLRATSENCPNAYQEMETSVYCQGGALGIWNLDEGSGSTTSDSSGNRNTGTLTGMNTTGNSTSGWNSTCKNANCLLFDGVNDYVSIGHIFGDDGSAISIEAWAFVKRDDNTTGTDIYQGIVAAAQTFDGGCCTARFGISEYHQNNNAEFLVGDMVVNDARIQFQPGFSLFNQWVHVVLVYNGTGVGLYQNY